MIYITHEPWPASSDVLAAAAAAGASQIVHDRSRPEGLVEDTPSLDEAKAAKWAAVKARRSALETGGCDTPSGRVQTDAVSIAKINGLVTMAMIAQGAGAPFDVGFTMEDNSVVQLDATEAITMGAAVGGYVAALFTHGNGLRALINAAGDAAAVAAIDIEVGWP